MIRRFATFRMLMLVAMAAGPAVQAHAQIISRTSSTTTSRSVETVPACSPVGSTRTVVTTTTATAGPLQCVGVGNRDVFNPAPLCGLFYPAPPPLDPYHGTGIVQIFNFQMVINTNTHTETITCEAAPTAPALPAAPVPAVSTYALAWLVVAIGLTALWRAWLPGRSRRRP